MVRVSVIMGIFNCAPTLEEALDSLYSQSFNDFEIIMCDDGSTDNTYEIALKYCESRQRIKLLRNSHNCGLNITLNKCLSLAEGMYIARMDGDDISLPGRFEKEVEFLDSHPEYAIVSTPMLYFDEQGVFAKMTGKGEPTINVFNYGSPFCHAPCMVRREALLSVGGYTESKCLIRYEDYNLWMKLYKKGYRGYEMEECLYAMRDDRNAASRRSFRVRLHGVYAHYIAYKELKLSFLKFIQYSVRVLMTGLIPRRLYIWLHRRNMSALVR